MQRHQHATRPVALKDWSSPQLPPNLQARIYLWTRGVARSETVAMQNSARASGHNRLSFVRTLVTLPFPFFFDALTNNIALEFYGTGAQNTYDFLPGLWLSVFDNPRRSHQHSACMSCGRWTSSRARIRLSNHSKSSRRSRSLHSPQSRYVTWTAWRTPPRYPTRLLINEWRSQGPFTTRR